MVAKRVVKMLIISITILFSSIILGSCAIKIGSIGIDGSNYYETINWDDTKKADNREGYSEIDMSVIRYASSIKKTDNLIANSVENMQIIYDSIILRQDKSAKIYLDLSDEDKLVYGEDITNDVAKQIFDKVVHSSTIQNSLFITHRESLNSGYDIVFDFTKLDYWEKATVQTSYDKTYYQYNSLNFGNESSTRTETFNDFKVESIKNTFLCTDSDQLWYTLEMGFKPVFVEGSSVEAIYKSAKSVLRKICDNDMSDVQKVKAIYEWLIYDVSYDNELKDMVGDKNITDSSSVNLKKYNGFYLEGVFNDHKAVCDGISKAFVLLANMEGIPCVRETGFGENQNVGHAWNKVFVEGKWYLVDATSGNLLYGDKEFIDYNYLLFSQENFGYTGQSFENIIANENYNIFDIMTIEYMGDEVSLQIESKAEFDNLLFIFEELTEGESRITLQIQMSQEILDNMSVVSYANELGIEKSVNGYYTNNSIILYL